MLRIDPHPRGACAKVARHPPGWAALPSVGVGDFHPLKRHGRSGPEAGTRMSPSRIRRLDARLPSHEHVDNEGRKCFDALSSSCSSRSCSSSPPAHFWAMGMHCWWPHSPTPSPRPGGGGGPSRRTHRRFVEGRAVCRPGASPRPGLHVARGSTFDLGPSRAAFVPVNPSAAQSASARLRRRDASRARSGRQPARQCGALLDTRAPTGPSAVRAPLRTRGSGR